MKKLAIVTAVCMALTAVPFVSAKGETPATLPAKAAAGTTYADVLESIINDHQYGNTYFELGSGYDVSDNGFSLYDVDEDGQDELIIWWDHTYQAAMMGVVYDKDASGRIFEKYVGSPYMTFCTNGVIQATEINNQGGLTDDPEMFLPHSLYRCSSPTGKYELLCSVDAWSKDYRATDYNGNPFPTSVDKSNTGYVFYVSTPGSTSNVPLDYKDYINKVWGLTGNIEAFEGIADYDLTLQNVRTYCTDEQIPSETQPTTTQTTATTTSTSTTSTTTTTTPTNPASSKPSVVIEQVTVTLDQLKAANYQVPVMIKIMHNPGVNALEFGVRCDLEYYTTGDTDATKYYANLPTASDSVADGLDLADDERVTIKPSSIERSLTWMTFASWDTVESRENIALLIVTVPEDAKAGDKYPIYFAATNADGTSTQLFQVKENGIVTDYVKDGNFEGLDGFIAIENAGETTPVQTTETTTTDTNTSQEPTIQTAKQYADALESIYYDHTLCGETFDPMGSVQDNQFAVCDVNGDGQEELLVRWTSATLEDTREAIFGINASGKLIHMGDVYPADGYGKQSYLTKYYSNGTAFAAETSDRFGMSGSQFWPFALYQYNPSTKTYEFKFFVRAWSESYSTWDDERNLTYPYSADTSGTGMVYYITTMSNGDYVGGDIPRDVTEFQALLNQYTQGATAIQPTYQAMTLGNIQTLRAKEATETTPVQTTETTTTSTTTTTTTKATTATTQTTTTTTTTTSTEAVSHSFGKSDKDCAIAIEQIEVPKDILEADGYQVPVLVKLDPNPGINVMEFGIECDYDYEIVDAKKYRDNKERLEPLFTSRAANSELEDGLNITMSYSKSAESGLSWLTWSSREVDDTIENLVAVIVTVPETAQPGDVIHIRYRDYGSGAFPYSHVIQSNQLGIVTDYTADYHFEGIDGYIRITEGAEPTQLIGDVNENGTINAEDASEILLFAAARGAGSSYESKAFNLEWADVDGNGSIDAADAANVLVYAAIAGSEGKADWDMVLGKSESVA